MNDAICNYPACMFKRWSNRFCCHCCCRHCKHKNRQISKSRHWTKYLMPPKQLKATKNCLSFATNHVGRPTSTTNHAFSPATPINHTYQCHVLFPLYMLDLKMGRGRQVIKSISRSITVGVKKWWCFHSVLSRLNRNEMPSHAQKNGNWTGRSAVTEGVAIYPNCS